MKRIHKVIISLVILALATSLAIATIEKINSKVEIIEGVPTMTIDGMKIPPLPGINKESDIPTTNYPEATAVPYSAIFGKRISSVVPITSSGVWIEIANLTFSVPVTVNANIEGSGQIANFLGYPMIGMSIDNKAMSTRWYVITRIGATDDCNSCQIGFQISSPHRLSAGTHKVKLFVFEFQTFPTESVYQQSITAMVDSRGKIEVS